MPPVNFGVQERRTIWDGLLYIFRHLCYHETRYSFRLPSFREYQGEEYPLFPRLLF